MDNEDLREQQEEESLIKQAAKKAISKKIKGIPPSTKIWIIGIILGIVFFLVVFITLIASVIPFFYFVDDDEESGSGSGFIYIGVNSSENYWWPIGGSEVENYNGVDFAPGAPTSTAISSYFGYRDMDDDGEKEDYHEGMDIRSLQGGKDYIISVAKGTIYATNDTCDNSGGYGNSCGGKMGNYVMISHPNGIYTIYAHLYPGSITVSPGDSVEQGQIIGKMGNSGSSTGYHLHFQIEEGARSQANAVDPLLYISPDNPRPVTIDEEEKEEIPDLSEDKEDL